MRQLVARVTATQRTESSQAMMNGSDIPDAKWPPRPPCETRSLNTLNGGIELKPFKARKLSQSLLGNTAQRQSPVDLHDLSGDV